MSFRKMTKEKRNQLFGVVAITVLALAALGFGLIKLQYDKLQQLALKRAEAESKLNEMETAVKNADQVKAVLDEVSRTLSEKESTMATGDLYSWSIATMKRFKTGYKVEIPQFGPISQPADVNLLPRFPYKQATFNIAGKAYYHELGRFISDFENQFPFMRVINLNLDQEPSQTASDREKLSFKMDIVTLVKPG